MDKPAYTVLVFKDVNQEQLFWVLNHFQVEGIHEEEGRIQAYWSNNNFEKIAPALEKAIDEFHLKLIQKDKIIQQNWNAKWEANFKPIIIEDFVQVRAPFHPKQDNIDYDILIEPKMAFGTGHHATTFQVIKMMRKLPLSGQRVLDFGAGTGILSILAHQLGAKNIIAIDNDPLCTESMKENFPKNNIHDADIRLGSIDILENQKFNLILANINRNVLLDNVQAIHDKLVDDGKVIISGILQQDKDLIMDAFSKKFNCSRESEKNKWLCIEWDKK